MYSTALGGRSQQIFGGSSGSSTLRKSHSYTQLPTSKLSAVIFQSRALAISLIIIFLLLLLLTAPWKADRALGLFSRPSMLALETQNAWTSVFSQRSTLSTEPSLRNFTQIRLSLGSKPSIFIVSWTTFAQLEDEDTAYKPAVAYLCSGNEELKEIIIYATSARNYTEGGWNGIIHSAIIEGPAGVCKYKVGEVNPQTPSKSRWSREYEFVVSSITRTGRLRLAVYGDMGLGTEAHYTVTQLHRDILNEAGLDLVVHLGDFCYVRPENIGKKWNISHEWYQKEKTIAWDEWFDLIEPVASRVPYITVPGNHEKAPYDFDFIPYANRFVMPIVEPSTREGNKSKSLKGGFVIPKADPARLWYSFHNGPVYFLMLSSEHDYSPGSAQYVFVESQLRGVNRRKFPWIIVCIHRPLYSSNVKQGSVVALQQTLGALFEQYGVDLVLCGHDHAYERTLSIRNGEVAESGPVYVRIGTAGMEPDGHFVEPQPEWSAIRLAEYGYLRLDVDGGTRLRGEFIRTVHKKTEGEQRLKTVDTHGLDRGAKRHKRKVGPGVVLDEFVLEKNGIGAEGMPVPRDSSGWARIALGMAVCAVIVVGVKMYTTRRRTRLILPSVALAKGR